MDRSVRSAAWASCAVIVAALITGVATLASTDRLPPWNSSIDASAPHTRVADAGSPDTPGGPATPTANGDEQFIQAGQCVRNIGDAENMVLKIADCDSGTLRILARIAQAITYDYQADALCGREAPSYTDYHYSNWEKRSDYIDIVFCLGPA